MVPSSPFNCQRTTSFSEGEGGIAKQGKISKDVPGLLACFAAQRLQSKLKKL